jgi:hypothetical protein
VSSVPDFLRDRVVADSHDRPAWLRARAMGITATDAAHLATPRSVRNATRSGSPATRTHSTGAIASR